MKNRDLLSTTPGQGEPQFPEPQRLESRSVDPTNPSTGQPVSWENRRRRSSYGPILESFISRDDLAVELGVSTRTLTRWTFQPNGIPHVEIGNKTLYLRSSVTAWLESREQRPTRTKRNQNVVSQT